MTASNWFRGTFPSRLIFSFGISVVLQKNAFVNFKINGESYNLKLWKPYPNYPINIVYSDPCPISN